MNDESQRPLAGDLDRDLGDLLEELHESIVSEKLVGDGETRFDQSTEIRLKLDDAAECLRMIERLRQRQVAGDQQGEEFESPQRIERFQIEKKLGEGGFGIVYQAFDPQLKRQVAIKIPRPEIQFSPKLRQRFLREAEVAASLRHPAIVQVLQAGRADHVQFISSELCEGPSLADWLGQATEPITPRIAAEVLLTLADAVQYAHSRGVLHRDLKPGNVMLNRQDASPSRTRNNSLGETLGEESDNAQPITADELPDAAQITDFGLARFVEQDAEKTQSGVILGTPAYMSPEQADGRLGDFCSASDVFALGAILYELLVGEPPFTGESVAATLEAVRSQEPMAPSRKRPSIPRDLEAICLKCLEKNPAARYATARELHADLQRFLSGDPVVARPVTRAARLLRWAKRNPATATATLAAIAFLLATVAASTLGWLTTRQALLGEQAANQQAQARYLELKDAIDTYYRRVEANPELRNMPGGEQLRSDLLSLALNYYQRYQQDHQDDPELAIDIAQTRLSTGDILMEMGQVKAAIQQYDEALLLVEVKNQRADETEVRKLKPQLLHQKAKALFAKGELDDALGFGERARKLQQKLVDQDAEDAVQLKRLAENAQLLASVRRGRSEQLELLNELNAAQSLYEKLDELTDDRESHLALLRVNGEIASALRLAGRVDEAEQLSTKTYADLQSFAADNVNYWEAQKAVTIAAAQVATGKLMQGDFDGASSSLELADTASKRLSWLHPTVAEYKSIRIGILQRLANYYQGRNDLENLEKTLTELVQVSEAHHQLDPSAASGKLDYSSNLGNLVVFRLRNDLPLGDSVEACEDALALLAALVEQQPDNYEFRISYAFILDVRSQVALAEGDDEIALHYSDDAMAQVEACKALGVQHPKITFYTWSILTHHAQVQTETGDHEAARDTLKSCLAIAPPNAQIEMQLKLALAHQRLRESSDAAAIFDTVDISKCRKGNLLLVARYHALAAKSDSPDQGDPIKRCVEALQTLATQGDLTDARMKLLRTHEDFAALRKSPSFAEFTKQAPQ